MDAGLRRWRVSGVGFVGVGAVGAAFSFLRLDATLAAGLFALIAAAGGFLPAQRRKAYSVTLLAVGVLALGFGVVGYLTRGFATLTALYLLLGVVGAARGVQAYRAID